MSSALVVLLYTFGENFLVSSVRSVQSTAYHPILIDHFVSEVVLCPSWIILYLLRDRCVYRYATGDVRQRDKNYNVNECTKFSRDL